MPERGRLRKTWRGALRALAAVGLGVLSLMLGVPLSPVARGADDSGANAPGPAIVGVLVVVILLLVVLVWAALRRSRNDRETVLRIARLYEEAQADTFFDSLTGLGNRRSFEAELASQVVTFGVLGTPVALVLIDIDDLGAVNGRDGQQAGDDLLVGVAEVLQQLSRPEDRAYRIGGDEFALILPDIDVGGAVAVAERVLHYSRRPPSGLRPCSFSCGVSGVPDFTTRAEVLRPQAQKAMEWVKAHGRAAVEPFDPDRDRIVDHPHEASRSAIQDVLTSKMLRPVFQPIVDLQSGRVLGFEALIRSDPSGPLPGTSQLFEAAAASGRTVELDLACIEVALIGARAVGHDRLITLNLSPRTLEVKDFDSAWLLQALLRNGISPSRVILELTEREAVSDVRRLQRTFSHLQTYGLRLAIDDVGAGNAGLRLLSQLRFDIVKIDLSLVHEGTQGPGARAVLQSLQNLALSQHSMIIAEGVETVEQLQVVRDLRIGAGQGYLLGRPDTSVAATFVDVRRLAGDVPAFVPGHQLIPAWPAS